MKTRSCQWLVRKMLICSISDTWVVFGNVGFSERAAAGRRYPASAEFSAIRHSAGNPPIPWCGLRGTSPGETGHLGVREYKSSSPVSCAQHAPGTERSQRRQGAGFDQMRAHRLKSKRPRRNEPGRSAHLQITSHGRDDVMDAKRRVVATGRAFDLWNRVSLLWNQCSHCKPDRVTIVPFKVTITVTHLTVIAWRITAAATAHRGHKSGS